MDYGIFLSITSYLHKEQDYVPFSAALEGFKFMGAMLQRTAAYGDFKVHKL